MDHKRHHQTSGRTKRIPVLALQEAYCLEEYVGLKKKGIQVTRLDNIHLNINMNIPLQYMLKLLQLI
jgi:hypothetical protein